MKYVLHLSGENLDFAKTEALNLIKPEKSRSISQLLIIETGKTDIFKRLAYTRSAFEYLFECESTNLEKNIKEFDWQKIYEKDFSVRIKNLTDKEISVSEKELAGLIWNRVKCPKVNLKDPSTKLVFLVTNKKVIFGKQIFENIEPFSKRRAHLRPILHPTSLHPKLARACINLTGLEKGSILDPFCGTAGILIEAGLLGFRTIGMDISQEMLEKAEITLKHFKIKDFRLEKNDSSRLSGKADAIVTDLPYGKGSFISKKIGQLYKEFFSSALNITENMVVLLPDFTDYKGLVKGWKVTGEFDYFLHKSLSKRILVLKRL